MSYEECRAPLSDPERRQLRFGLWSIGFFTVFCVGLFTLMLTFVVSHEGWAPWPIFVVGAFAAIFATVIAVQLRRVLEDLSLGQVIVLRGQVAQKSQYTRRSKRSATGRTSYYLHFGSGSQERQVKVAPPDYNRSHEGDQVEIRMAPHSKRVFSVKVPERTAKQQTPEQTEIGAPTSAVAPARSQLSDADRTALRRHFFRLARRHILMLAFGAYFLFYFVWEGMWGIVLLFFPVALMFLYQVFALSRTIWLYLTERRANIKIGLVLTVTDRLKTRYGQTHHVLCFGRQRLEVDPEIFNRVQVGDQVAVYTGQHSGLLLAVTV
jgi:hypothetical protein